MSTLLALLLLPCGSALQRLVTSHGISSSDAAALVAAALESTGVVFEPVPLAGLCHERCAVFEGIPRRSELLDGIAASLDERGVAPLLSLGSDDAPWTTPERMRGRFDAAVRDHSDAYGLRVPVATRATGWTPDACRVVDNVALDGAWVDGADARYWDTSRVVSVDGLVDDALRAELLELCRADPVKGVDRRSWRRGALRDVIGGDDDVSGACWGLAETAIRRLCDETRVPEPIREVQSRIAAYLARRNDEAVVLSRISAAALDGVTPLTANAPVAADGDAYGWHIDGDPMLLPNGPWTDFHGRYPNRAPGKPRWVSAVIYLPHEWRDAWGAPTRFLDPPTREVLDVAAAPGRVVLLDQDITHSVQAPSAAAGDRPRYSLVLKLVLHPTAAGQVPSIAPEDGVRLFGSASRPDD